MYTMDLKCPVEPLGLSGQSFDGVPTSVTVLGDDSVKGDLYTRVSTVSLRDDPVTNCLGTPVVPSPRGLTTSVVVVR